MYRTQAGSILAGVMLVIFGLAASAQGPSTVSERVRTTMLAQEPGWQLEKSEIEDAEFFHRWVNRAESITITYVERESAADASAWMAKLPLMMSSGAGEPLAGVGDEAMIWARTTGSGSASIFFIRGRSSVQVTGPSQTITTRIAQLVAAQID